MQNGFTQAMEFRHACKLFDTNRFIPQKEFEYILNAGRMSPSSLGLEHWKFLVIRNSDLKEKIRTLAWNQPQVTTASELVIVLYKKYVHSDSLYTARQFKKNFNLDPIPGAYKAFIDAKEGDELYHWSSKQTYLAAANMMTAAAFLNIDSCPMEGFDYYAVEQLLQIDTDNYGIAMMLPFGYRVNEQQPHTRSNLEKLVEYI